MSRSHRLYFFFLSKKNQNQQEQDSPVPCLVSSLGSSHIVNALCFFFKASAGLLSRSGRGQSWKGRWHSTLTGTSDITRSNKSAENFRANVSAPPTPVLARLPTSMLLRSLMLAAVSSSPYFFRPCLLALSFLFKQQGGFLFNVKRNPLLYWPLKWTFHGNSVLESPRLSARRLYMD